MVWHIKKKKWYINGFFSNADVVYYKGNNCWTEDFEER